MNVVAVVVALLFYVHVKYAMVMSRRSVKVPRYTSTLYFFVETK